MDIGFLRHKDQSLLQNPHMSPRAMVVENCEIPIFFSFYQKESSTMDAILSKSFAHVTWNLLDMIPEATVMDADPTSPIAPSQLAQWQGIFRQAREGMVSDAHATVMLNTLTRYIRALLQTFLENELLDGIRAAIYARTEEASMLEIARLMLISFEELLGLDLWVSMSSYVILSQMVKDIALEELDLEVKGIEFPAFVLKEEPPWSPLGTDFDR